MRYLLCGVAWVALVGSATAQSPETSPGEEMITVTALKRNTPLADAPIAVTVASGEELLQQNITSLADFESVVSGFEIRQSPNNTPAITLRGLGTGTGSMAFEQSIGVFVDGAYLGHGRTFNAGFFDIQQVEVLRGTSAALLGQNTSLGAIAFTTRRPSGEGGYNLLANYEFEFESWTLGGGADIPVTDNFALRIAVQHRDKAGWVENTIANHFGPEVTEDAIRLSALWQPSPAWDVSTIYTYLDSDRVGDAVETLNDWGSIAGGYPPFNTPGFLSSLGPAGYPGDSVFDYKGETYGFRGEETEDSQTHLGVFNASYELPSGQSVAATVSYLDYGMSYFSPSGHAYYDVLNFDISESERQYTGELRFLSDKGGRVEYLAGLYASRDEWSQFHVVQSYGSFPGGPYNAANPPPPPSPSVPPAPVSGRFNEVISTTTETQSAFVSVTLNVFDRTSIDLGARYTNQEREAQFGRNFDIGAIVPASPIIGCLGGVGPTAGYLPSCAAAAGGFVGTQTQTSSWDSFDYSVGARHYFTESLSIYGSYARGSKGPGFANQTGVAGQPFGEEIAETTEVGLRGNFDDGSFSIALFHTDLEGLQRSVFTGSVFIITNRNLTSEGVDLSFDWSLLEQFRIGGNVTYADTQHEVSPGDPSVQPGSPAEGAPLWSGSLFAEYETPIFSNYTLTIAPSVDFRDEINLRDLTRGPFNCASGPTEFAYSCFYPRSDAYAKFNLRVALASEQGWDLALIGRNLNDEASIAYVFPSPGGFGTQGVSEPPRTVTLQFTQEF